MRAHRVDLLLVLGLVLLALVLRLHQLMDYPVPNETADEYAFLWAGWSWLHDGVATSWSWKPAYGAGTKVFAHGTLYQLVTPWMDHPPLFALLVGAAASLSSARELLDVPLRAGRLVAVLLGSASVGLLYAVARERYGRAVAALAGLMLAVIPTIVLADRLVVAEALLVPLLLVGLLGAVHVIPSEARSLDRRARPPAPGEAATAEIPRRCTPRDDSKAWLAVALAAAFCASLAKVPGVFVGLALAAFLATNGARRPAVYALVASGLGLVPYGVYGAIANLHTFIAVISDQSGRSSGIEVLPFLLTGASTGPVSWRDAWFPFLWLALAYAAYRRDALVVALTIPYLVVMVAAVDQSVPRVWYREPLFPGLCLAGALFLKEAIAAPDAIKSALVVFGLAFGKLAEGFNAWQVIGPVGQRLFPFAVLLLAVPLLLGWRRVLRWEVGGALAIALIAGCAQAWQPEATYPAYTPPKYEEVAIPTTAGASVLRYRAEPDVLSPGGTLHVGAVWKIERDGSYATRLVGGSEARLSGKAGDEVALEYTGTVSSSGPVLLQIEGQTLDLGLIRVR